VSEHDEQTIDPVDGGHASRECMACHGTGHVISMLGGERGEVDCPWCAGSGVRRPGVDAQAHWAASAGADDQAETA
jgi:DnaJ-class molecular chaperone